MSDESAKQKKQSKANSESDVGMGHLGAESGTFPPAGSGASSGSGVSGDTEQASKVWLKDYLKKVYGVKMSGSHTLQRELLESGQHHASNIVADDFLFRLLARFNDLDIAPCDGFISMAELEHAINVPRLYFDGKDNLMLKVLKRYFETIRDVCAEENSGESSHYGISRHDLEVLTTSSTKRSLALKKRLNDEFAQKEPG